MGSLSSLHRSPLRKHSLLSISGLEPLPLAFCALVNRGLSGMKASRGFSGSFLFLAKTETLTFFALIVLFSALYFPLNE